MSCLVRPSPSSIHANNPFYTYSIADPNTKDVTALHHPTGYDTDIASLKVHGALCRNSEVIDKKR